MLNLQELNELYKTPEQNVKQEVEGSLQGVSNIGNKEKQDKSYAQTGVVKPEVINEGGRPTTQVNQPTQANQGLTTSDISNWGIEKTEEKPTPEKLGGLSFKSFVNPTSGQVSIGYVKPDPHYTPEEQKIVAYIPEDKQAGRANFNSEFIVPYQDFNAVLKVINKYQQDIPQEALQVIVNEFKQLEQIQDPNQKLELANLIKVHIGKLLEDTKLPGRLYAKGDPSYDLLYKYIEKAKKLNGYIQADGATIHQKIENEVKNRFIYGTFNPKAFGTSLKAKVELRSDPIWINELERIKKESPEMYYVLIHDEKKSPTLGTYEKKILYKIYDDYVKPMSTAYNNVKKMYGEAQADKMFPSYKRLEQLTSLRYKSYFDDVLDKLYSPVQIDPNSLTLGMFANIEGYTLGEAKISGGTNYTYKSKSTYTPKPDRIYPTKNREIGFTGISF